VTVFDAANGPCYRCLFPDPPPPEFAPNCAEAGVLGVLPGLIGLLQATEVLKLLLGIGEPLVGRLLHVEALGMRFRETRLRPDPACRACAPGAMPPTLADEPWACAAAGQPARPD
jgi:molybdopterin/thiamine biosynthesis adenylyltransferase